MGPAAQNAVFNLGGADVQGGQLVFDYNGAASPAATIEGLLTDSCHDGLWDVGQFRSSTAALAGLTLGWFDDGSSKVTVMPTYAGDFNLDVRSTALDLDIWKSNAGAGTTWQRATPTTTAPSTEWTWIWKATVGLPPVGGGRSLAGLLPSESPSLEPWRCWPPGWLACSLAPGGNKGNGYSRAIAEAWPL